MVFSTKSPMWRWCKMWFCMDSCGIKLMGLWGVLILGILYKISVMYSVCNSRIPSPDATDPDDHTAMDVFLALRLLRVCDADVLPLAGLQQFVTWVSLRQQPSFYFIIGVSANPEGETKISVFCSLGKFEHSVFCTFDTWHQNHLNVREPVERLAQTWSIRALEPIDKMWTRLSSTNLVAGWQELWWSSATAGFTSPGRDNRATVGF